MRGFDEREKSLEAEFKHREEQAFRVTVHRNRLFGLWAAAKLGLAPGDASEAYAKSVVAADFEAPGDEDVIAKVLADFVAKGVACDDVEVRAALSRAGVEGRVQSPTS